MSVDSRPQVSTLDNGMQLVLSELPHARSVSISIYIRAGQRYEASPADAGISHFVEHLCFKGTERRPGRAMWRPRSTASAARSTPPPIAS